MSTGAPSTSPPATARMSATARASAIGGSSMSVPRSKR
jgi:hypothetical protein